MSTLPDDRTLTERGFEAPGGTTAAGRILVLACGALAREILDIMRLNGWDHVDLRCLPAKLHLYPERITGEVERVVSEVQDAYDEIFVAYADCGTGGLLQQACDRLGLRMIAGPHCYSFFEGQAAFAAHAEEEIGTFYLTDFLVRQFDAFVWKPMGLDRHPELRDMYFGNYTKLVYQAQTDDPELTEAARACAERLGLPFERRFTGYGDLRARLEEVAATDWQKMTK